MLTYRDSDHSYFWEGRPVPGITRVLADLNCYPGAGFYTENSRVRGQMGHLACQLADEHCAEAQTLADALDVLDVAEDIQPFLEGYLKFRRENRYRARRWEQTGFSRRLRVAGRWDTDGLLDGREAVLDVKTWANQGANPKHSSAVQTGFYGTVRAEELACDPAEIERYVLKLPGDGGYRLYHCDNPSDFVEAAQACSLWWAWHQHGIFKFAGDPEQPTGE